MPSAVLLRWPFKNITQQFIWGISPTFSRIRQKFSLTDFIIFVWLAHFCVTYYIFLLFCISWIKLRKAEEKYAPLHFYDSWPLYCFALANTFIRASKSANWRELPHHRHTMHLFLLLLSFLLEGSGPLASSLKPSKEVWELRRVAVMPSLFSHKTKA